MDEIKECIVFRMNCFYSDDCLLQDSLLRPWKLKLKTRLENYSTKVVPNAHLSLITIISF